MTDRDERIERLRPRLTDEFLATLVEASEVTMFDPIEIDGFIRDLYDMAGKERLSGVNERLIKERIRN